MARVRIVTAGHEVEVEDDEGDPDEIASLALWLHGATRDRNIDRAFGFAGADTQISVDDR